MALGQVIAAHRSQGWRRLSQLRVPVHETRLSQTSTTTNLLRIPSPAATVVARHPGALRFPLLPNRTVSLNPTRLYASSRSIGVAFQGSLFGSQSSAPNHLPSRRWFSSSQKNKPDDTTGGSQDPKSDSNNNSERCTSKAEFNKKLSERVTRLLLFIENTTG